MRKLIAGIRKIPGNSEIVRYLIIGVLTTLVNIAITIIGNRYFGLEWRYYTNKVAYVSAILFAYAANRRYVFRSGAKILPELVRFSASRLLISLIFEDGGYYLLYDVLLFQAMMPILRHVPWAKFFGMVFVVIANYLVGKFLVFTGKNSDTKKDTDLDRKESSSRQVEPCAADYNDDASDRTEQMSRQTEPCVAHKECLDLDRTKPDEGNEEDSNIKSEAD